MKNKISLILCVLMSFSLKAQRYKEVAVQVVQPQSLTVSSIGGKFLLKRNQISISFKLPENTIRWFYTFTASRNQEDVERTRQKIKLVAQLSKLIDETGTTKNAINLLTAPPGSDFCNVYHLRSQEDAIKFEKEFSLKSFAYDMAGSRTNLKHGIVDVPDYLKGYQYLGFQNPSRVYEVNVSIEVVAIVNEEVTDNRGYLATTKNRIFGECLKLMNYAIVAEDRYKTEICSCVTDELTSKYNQKEMQELPDFKISEQLGEGFKVCAQKIDESKRYKEPKIANEILGEDVPPTTINMISKYKTNNCYMSLNYDGSIIIEWFSGKKTEGRWKLEDKTLVCNYFNSEYRYFIVSNKPHKMTYRDMVKGTVYEAEKIVN